MATLCRKPDSCPGGVGGHYLNKNAKYQREGESSGRNSQVSVTVSVAKHNCGSTAFAGLLAGKSLPVTFLVRYL